MTKAKTQAEKDAKKAKDLVVKVAKEVEEVCLGVGGDVVGVGEEKVKKDAEIAASAENLENVESVDVLKGEGKEYIRSYSREVHVDEFLALARQFQQKHPTVTIVDSEVIEKVIVRYREKEDFEKPLKEQNPDSPQVDKEGSFQDKDEALAFNAAKKGSIVVKR